MWFQNFYDTFYKCFIKEDRYQLLLDGIGVTVKVSLLAVVFGLLIGFLIALCNLSNKKGIRLIGKVYTDIIRGTPTVTQLMIIYFVIFASVHWPKWVIAAIAFGINSGAYHSGRNPLCGQGTDRSRSFAGLKRQTNHDSDCRSAGCKEYFPSTLQRIYHLDQGNGDCWLCWLGRHSESRRLHQDLYI